MCSLRFVRLYQLPFDTCLIATARSFCIPYCRYCLVSIGVGGCNVRGEVVCCFGVMCCIIAGWVINFFASSLEL